MIKKACIGVLAAVFVLMITAAAGWTADPKAPAKPAPAQKMERKAETTEALIDLNTATKAQLLTLEGVGERTAQRIIQHRPYAKKDQLKSKKILTPQEYDRIRDKIIAKQPAK